MTWELSLLRLKFISKQAFSVYEYDLTILVILAPVDEEDILKWLAGFFPFNLKTPLCTGSISLGSWHIFLIFDEIMLLCDLIWNLMQKQLDL
jgi:hypothetical protein